MAEEEAALEGFFAKKDKTKKPKKKKKTKVNETVVKETDAQKPQVDEWKDFEEEKEKDFSNLKIADLQVGDENAKDIDEEKNEDETDGNKSEDENSSIWKTSNSAAPPPAQPTPPPEAVGTQNVVGGKYVPPSVKRATMAAASKPVQRRRQGVPPDLNNQSAFPSLSAASQDNNTKLPSDFEVVKRGTRNNEARVDDRPALEIGNRYDGLRS